MVLVAVLVAVAVMVETEIVVVVVMADGVVVVIEIALKDYLNHELSATNNRSSAWGIITFDMLSNWIVEKKSTTSRSVFFLSNV